MSTEQKTNELHLVLNTVRCLESNKGSKRIQNKTQHANKEYLYLFFKVLMNNIHILRCYKKQNI